MAIKKDHLAWIVLLTLFAFHFINNIVIIFRDTTPFMGDSSDYYKISFYYWKAFLGLLHHGDPQGLGVFRYLQPSGVLPALVAIPFFLVLGVSHDTAVIANQLFFIVLILSIYGIGRRLFDRKTGLLAAWIISFCPAVFGFSRIYMMEFPALAIASLCVYWLIRSDGFKDLKYSLCFGLAFALGELLRPRFLLYVMIPVLYYMVKNIVSFLRGRSETSVGLSVRTIANHTFLAALFSCLLLSPWYLPQKNMVEYLYFQKIWSTGPAFQSIIATMPHYLGMLWSSLLGWFFTALFFLGLGTSLLIKKKRQEVFFLLIWSIFSLILLSLFGVKDHPRLMIPLLAPIALVASSGIIRLSRWKLGHYAILFILFFGTGQYFFICYGKTSLAENPAKRCADIFLRRGLWQAERRDWGIEGLLPEFQTRRNFNAPWSWQRMPASFGYLRSVGCRPVSDHSIRVLFMDYRGSALVNEVEERTMVDELPLSVAGLYGEAFDGKAVFSDEEMQRIVLGADYVVKVKKAWPRGSFAGEILSIFDANISEFERMKTLETSEGETLIYGKKMEKK